MKNFDEFIAIDWSGALKPIHSKAIAVAHCVRGTSAPKLLSPPHHKLWSRTDVAEFILSLPRTKRILIGIDCNFGYAESVLRQQIPHAKTAKDLWALVDDICDDEANFSAQSFWTNAHYKKYFWSSGEKPRSFHLPQRLVEQQCAHMGLGVPESPFKLIGPKQVGKGGLSGMRLVHHLKTLLKNEIAIWPFDSIEDCNKAPLVITEIYPRLFLKLTGHGNSKIRNNDDLTTALKALGSKTSRIADLNDHVTDALIAAAGLRFLCGNDDLIAADFINPRPRNVIACEGWIWGVPQNKNKAQ